MSSRDSTVSTCFIRHCFWTIAEPGHASGFVTHFGASGECWNGGRYCWSSQTNSPLNGLDFSSDTAAMVDCCCWWSQRTGVECFRSMHGCSELGLFDYNLTVNFDLGLESDADCGSEVGFGWLVKSSWRCLSRCD